MARAVHLNATTRAMWRLHRRVYGRFGGRVGTLIGSFPVLLLTTTGRKTGRPRAVTLNFVDIEGGVAVIGSYAGEPRDPAWALNLRVHAAVTVTIGRERIPAIAREVFGEERSRIARMFEERDHSYTMYRERTSRALPVFVFEATES